MPANQDRFLLAAAALLFSTGGAAIKACTLTGWQIASIRSGIAAVCLLALFPAARKGWTWRTLVVGLAYAATLIAFVTATKLTTSANAIFLQSTSPLYLLLLSPWFLREAVRRVDILTVGGVAAGAVLLLRGSQTAIQTAPNPTRGNLLALAAGFFLALTIAGLRALSRRGESTVSSTVAGNTLAFLICLPPALPIGHIDTRDVLILLYLGIFQLGLGYLLLTRSLQRISALEASTLLMLEPVCNPIWSWLVHRERPSYFALLGGAVILTTSLASTWWRVRNSASKGIPASERSWQYNPPK